MRAFELDRTAEAELNHLIDYIARDSLDAAALVLEEFDALFAELAQDPDRGFHRPELASVPVRFWVHRRYLVAYDPDSRPLRIIGIIRGMRRPKTIARLLEDR